MAKGLQWGVLRDIYCGQNVAELQRWNCLEKNYEFYCCGYHSGKDGLYHVYENELECYRFFMGAWKNNNYPTVPYKNAVRTKAEQDEYQLKHILKKNTAQLLKKQLEQNFLHQLDELGQTPSCNFSEPIMKKWKTVLHGNYDVDQLLLYQGVLNLAANHKVLSELSYKHYSDWIERMLAQCDCYYAKQKNLSRTFYGFAYCENEKGWKYCYDAQRLMVLKKHCNYQETGVITTPIWQKTYYCHYDKEFSQIRRKFETELKLNMNKEYLACVKQLWGMPSSIDKQKWLDIFSEKREHHLIERQTIEYYAHIWHLN